MDIIYIMDWVCLIVTLFMFMTGIPPCVQMYKKNDTKNVPYIFFLLSILSCSGMFHYGLLISNSTITFINGCGGVLQVCYACIYLYVVQPKGTSVGMLMGTLGYQAAVYWYLYNVVPKSDFVDTLGLMSSTIITIIAVVPIFEIINNVRNKNADGMPAVMIFGGLACGCSWLIYGLLLQDPNIYRPNIPGIAVASAKLLAIAVYSGSSDKDKKVQ